MLIIIMALGGLLWFDYLGVVHIKSIFTPVYRIFGRTPPTSTVVTSTRPLVADIDTERLEGSENLLICFEKSLIGGRMKSVKRKS